MTTHNTTILALSIPAVRPTSLTTRSRVSFKKSALVLLTQEKAQELGRSEAYTRPERGNPREFISHMMEGEEKPILYGIELEYHLLWNSRSFEVALEAFQRLHGISFFFTKLDGSLSSGLEIVSHPFSKKWFYAHQNLFRNLLTLVYEFGGKVNQNAGLHIHISRQGLTNKTKAKIFYFINERANRNLMQKVAGRNSDQYSKYFEGIPLLTEEGMNYLESSSGKYEAVNWKHDNTLEVRIFKSTTTTTKLFGRLEFLFSIFDFFRTQKRTTGLIDGHYREYLKKSNYKNAKLLLEEDAEY